MRVFVGAITSGEVTHARLSQRPGPFWQQLGQRCLHLTWGARGAVSLTGLGLQVEAPSLVICLDPHDGSVNRCLLWLSAGMSDNISPCLYIVCHLWCLGAMRSVTSKYLLWRNQAPLQRLFTKEKKLNSPTLACDYFQVPCKLKGRGCVMCRLKLPNTMEH